MDQQCYFCWCEHLGGGSQGRQEDWGGPQNGLCEGGLGHAPGNLEIFQALTCVLGVSEALFHAFAQYIYTCKLPSLISG